MTALTGPRRAPETPTSTPGPAFAPESPPPLAPRHRLDGRELLALQLLARGYSVDQVAALRRAAVVDVLWDLQRALTVLGVPTVREAVASAKERGLLA